MKSSSLASEPSELLSPAMQVVSILSSESRPVTPLNVHFTVLATVTLLNLLDSDSTREEADRGIHSILEIHNSSSTLDNLVRDLINKKTGGGATNHVLTASQGLQHLADLATATDPTRSENIASETRPESSSAPSNTLGTSKLIRAGFLSALST